MRYEKTSKFLLNTCGGNSVIEEKHVQNSGDIPHHGFRAVQKYIKNENLYVLDDAWISVHSQKTRR